MSGYDIFAGVIGTAFAVLIWALVLAVIHILWKGFRS